MGIVAVCGCFTGTESSGLFRVTRPKLLMDVCLLVILIGAALVSVAWDSFWVRLKVLARRIGSGDAWADGGLVSADTAERVGERAGLIGSCMAESSVDGLECLLPLLVGVAWPATSMLSPGLGVGSGPTGLEEMRMGSWELFSLLFEITEEVVDFVSFGPGWELAMVQGLSLLGWALDAAAFLVCFPFPFGCVSFDAASLVAGLVGRGGIASSLDVPGREVGVGRGWEDRVC